MTCAKVFTKGAAEVVLSMCDNQLLPDGSVAPMSDEDKQQLLATFGKDGRRYVLCVLYLCVCVVFVCVCCVCCMCLLYVLCT